MKDERMELIVKSNIFVPKKIKVGYQNRSDTYTKKLAYVIYYDEKGKLRKENSWRSWRDFDIEPDDFTNEPISGFVLNKKVGDYDSGWNHRHAYVRIYDPRNFEFEISIENLLYILENTSSIKGKGLEGDFVYGWDSKDLVLIPTESSDYKAIKEYNSYVHDEKQIRGKDLIVGATYLTKDNTERIYIGRYDYYSTAYKWLENGECKISKNWRDIPENGYRRIDYDCIYNFLYGKYFWFARKYDDKWSFEKFKNIAKGKFIKCIDEKCTEHYSEICESLEKSCEYSPYDESLDKYVESSIETFISEGKEKRWNSGEVYYVRFKFISDIGGKKETYMACPTDVENGLYVLKKFHKRDRDRNSYGYDIGFENETSLFPTKIETAESSWNRERYWRGKRTHEKESMIPINLEEMHKVMRPLYRQCYLKNGNEFKKEWTNESKR